MVAAALGEGEGPRDGAPDFATLKARGAERSQYLLPRFEPAEGAAPLPDLATFESEIEPILERVCFSCHGPEKSRGGFRADELDPDLVHGDDVDWWVDVQSVLSNGEMPPEGEGDLTAEERGRVIEWLAVEVQTASVARQSEGHHSSFRRMTRYEYEYALQDLFGLPFSFADDLPPDPNSEDGFQNSSEVLHLTPMQLRAYFESNRKALDAATVRGEQPAPLYWDVTMEEAALRAWGRQDAEVAKAHKNHGENPKKLEEVLKRLQESKSRRPRGAHFESLVTGRFGAQAWRYNGAKFAWAPSTVPFDPMEQAAEELALGFDHVATIPPRRGLIVELGEKIPEEGTLLVRVLASRSAAETDLAPSLQLHYGWRASNDSRAVVRVNDEDLAVEAAPGAPAIYEFRVPIPEISPRNWVRTTAEMGALPSPSEYIKLVNGSRTGDSIRVHRVQVTAPVFEVWPPASHRSVFLGDQEPPQERSKERAYAEEVLANFLPRVWRRPPTPDEMQRKLALFDALRPEASDFQAAMIEVLASALTAPQFLYVGHGTQAESEPSASLAGLATRLSMFLWCSTPDEELLELEAAGELSSPEVVAGQVQRMLGDPRAERFARHFVRQWLGMSLLDFLAIDSKVYPDFDASLKEAMAEEPVAFFGELLREDLSVLEFLHSDFTMANGRLAQHYGLEGVTGRHFRRVPVGDQPARGGLLAQAGLLAMNSDGTDSHPLKRGVWMLERILNDPPPPPPPAVPEIDLADPKIAKMTLKERIEDHRNDPACISCHAKIDPWGLAFENFDAVGSWRTEVQGKPVDAKSTLFNGQPLDGMDGLKRFLIENRQDQFVRALVHKMTAFALGRPLSFEDRAAIDGITAEVRKSGDGLATMVTLISTSDLFLKSR